MLFAAAKILKDVLGFDPFHMELVLPFAERSPSAPLGFQMFKLNQPQWQVLAFVGSV